MPDRIMRTMNVRSVDRQHPYSINPRTRCIYITAPRTAMGSFTGEIQPPTQE